MRDHSRHSHKTTVLARASIYEVSTPLRTLFQVVAVLHRAVGRTSSTSVNTGSEALVTVAVLTSVLQLCAHHPDQAPGHCPTGSPHAIAVDLVYVMVSLPALWYTHTDHHRQPLALRKPGMGFASRLDSDLTR